MIFTISARSEHDSTERSAHRSLPHFAVRVALIGLLFGLGVPSLTYPRAAVAASYRAGIAAQPSARQLLAQLAGVAAVKGSVHIQGDVNATAVKLDSSGQETPWTHVVSHSSTDQSYRENLNESRQLITTVSIQNGRTVRQTYRSHGVTASNRAANQSNGGAWSCQTLHAKHQGGPLFNLSLGYPVRNPVNLGPTTFRGIPVWHVQGTITTTFFIATSNPVRADYYINRTDGTLLQERAAPTADASEGPPGKSVRERAHGTMSVTYLQWGKPLHISLPPACRPKL